MLPRPTRALGAVVVRVRDHRARGRRLHAAPTSSGSSKRTAWRPAACLPATCCAIRRSRAIPHRIVATSSNTDMVMNDTFFVGVYPGLDSARLDHMTSVVRPLHERRARGGRAGVSDGAEAELRGRAHRRSRRARLYAGAAARAAGAAVPRGAVSAPRARSVRSDRLLAGVARVLDRQPAGAARSLVRITYAVHGRFTARMESDLAEGRQVWIKMPYGDFVDRRPRRRRAVRGRHRDLGVHRVSRGPDAGDAAAR